MNYLYIDIGNTSTKIAVFEHSQWKTLEKYDRLNTEGLYKYIKSTQQAYDKLLVSCVVKSIGKDLEKLCSQERLKLFTNNDIPYKMINYESASTMGVDRFLAAYGAWQEHQRPAIIVDCGTACTIDYVDKKGVFQGGVIMPGLKTLEDGLLLSTKTLPPVDRIIPKEWPPKTTQSALQWGILGSYIAAIDAHIERFRCTDQKADIWLTGGDSSLIEPLLKKINQKDNFLIFKGLQSMLVNVA